MRDGQDQSGQKNRRTLGIVVAAFVLLFVVLTWGPWSTRHVESNPGPSGTPGSTVVDKTPPPADSPSGNTTGSAR